MRDLKRVRSYAVARLSRIRELEQGDAADEWRVKLVYGAKKKQWDGPPLSHAYPSVRNFLISAPCCFLPCLGVSAQSLNELSRIELVHWGTRLIRRDTVGAMLSSDVLTQAERFKGNRSQIVSDQAEGSRKRNRPNGGVICEYR